MSVPLWSNALGTNDGILIAYWQGPQHHGIEHGHIAAAMPMARPRITTADTVNVGLRRRARSATRRPGRGGRSPYSPGQRCSRLHGYVSSSATARRDGRREAMPQLAASITICPGDVLRGRSGRSARGRHRAAGYATHMLTMGNHSSVFQAELQNPQDTYTALIQCSGEFFGFTLKRSTGRGTATPCCLPSVRIHMHRALCMWPAIIRIVRRGEPGTFSSHSSAGRCSTGRPSRGCWSSRRRGLCLGDRVERTYRAS